jgi:hypothetical protein
MKVRLVLGLTALVVVLSLTFASVALAQVSQATINAILKDAQDGTIDGNWTAAQVQAALNWVNDNPAATQYSELPNVLGEFLASLQAPGTTKGELAFTGSPVLLILAAGTLLMSGGFILRRRRA